MGEGRPQPCTLNLVQFGDVRPENDIRVPDMVQKDLDDIEHTQHLKKSIFTRTMTMNTQKFQSELHGYVIQLGEFGSLHIIPPCLMHQSVLQNKRLCAAMKLDQMKKTILKVHSLLGTEPQT